MHISSFDNIVLNIATDSLATRPMEYIAKEPMRFIDSTIQDKTKIMDSIMDSIMLEKAKFMDSTKLCKLKENIGVGILFIWKSILIHNFNFYLAYLFEYQQFIGHLAM